MTKDNPRPGWMLICDKNREACALSDEQIMGRALLLGFSCYPHLDPLDRDGNMNYSTVKYCTTGKYALLGETHVQCAFRWLEHNHPEALNG